MGRREEILDALLDIFENHGITNNFTMKDVAEKVCIGKSTIYEYFSTKEELLNQAMTRLIEQAYEKIQLFKFEDNSSFELTFKNELKLLYNISINSSYMFGLLNYNNQLGLPNEIKSSFKYYVENIRMHYESRFKDIYKLGIKEGLFTTETLIKHEFIISSIVAGGTIRLSNKESKVTNKDLDNYIDDIYNAIMKITR